MWGRWTVLPAVSLFAFICILDQIIYSKDEPGWDGFVSSKVSRLTLHFCLRTEQHAICTSAASESDSPHAATLTALRENSNAHVCLQPLKSVFYATTSAS